MLTHALITGSVFEIFYLNELTELSIYLVVKFKVGIM